MVKRGMEEVKVLASVVISDAGVFTTYQKLLPPEIQAKPGKADTSFCNIINLVPVRI